MKGPHYALAVVLGASVASLIAHRLGRAPAEAGAEPWWTIAWRAPATWLTPAQEPPAVVAERERLARENAELRSQLEAARAGLAEHDASLQQAKAQLEELRRPMTADIFSSTLRADLKFGEVVVTGGYKLADGRRLYAFAKPSLEDVDGTKRVKIQGHYVLISDEAVREVGLESLATNAANTLQHGEVWVPDEAASVLAKVHGADHAAIFSYSAVLLNPSRGGTIVVGDIRLKVTPTLAESGDALGLELRLEQAQENAGAK